MLVRTLAQVTEIHLKPNEPRGSSLACTSKAMKAGTRLGGRGPQRGARDCSVCYLGSRLSALLPRALHCRVPTAPRPRSGLTHNSTSTGKKGPSCHLPSKQVQKPSDWPRVGHVPRVRQPCFHQMGGCGKGGIFTISMTIAIKQNQNHLGREF